MLDFLKNLFLSPDKYKKNSEAIIISCFYNSENSEYRLKAFNQWYETIKHLNHKIVECVIGNAKPQLPTNPNIEVIYTQDLLWHKESILNKIISELPTKFKYVFWLDADIIFENKNWLVEAVEELKTVNILQPFSFCYHLEKDETKPNKITLEQAQRYLDPISPKERRVWRSFCANYVLNPEHINSTNYDIHGHVGFAWGAKREIFDHIKLYDKALIGGADHIIAHAATGQVQSSCITKAFQENLDEIQKWSEEFAKIIDGKIGYVPGNLYHIWHGSIESREYLKRIQDFDSETKNIKKRDKNGLFIGTPKTSKYAKEYFAKREVNQKNLHLHTKTNQSSNNNSDDGFLTSMVAGYATDSTLAGTLIGGNLAGAMIGDMLNNSEHNHSQPQEQNFGGGDTGGSGAESNFS